MRGEEITVGIAAFGRLASLTRCVEAVASGSTLPGELIVVDQAPSGEARRAVEGAGLPRASYAEQPRLGVSASRNLALERCAGAILAFTDDDCVPEPGWVAAIAAAFGEDQTPAAVTGRILALGDRPPGAHPVSLRTSTTPTDYRGQVLPWLPGSGGNFAARVEFLRGLGGWDRRLGPGTRGRAAEDAELTHRILRSGGTVRYEPAAVVCHEWQSWARRLSSRASYGYGIGALSGISLRRRDAFALRMLSAYVRLHLRELAVAACRRDPAPVAEHTRALGTVVPGLLYGLRSRSPDALR